MSIFLCTCLPSVGFPDNSVGKESACNAGDPSSIPGLGRSAGEGIGYPLQDSWASLVAQLVKNPPAMWETWVRSLSWEDPLEKGTATHSSILAWRIPWTIYYIVHGVTKSWTWLSDFHLPSVCLLWRNVYLVKDILKGGLPWLFSGKESACNAGDPGSIIPRSPGGRHGIPLQYSCLENSMDRRTWWATVHRVMQSQTTERRKQQRQTPEDVTVLGLCI